MQQPSAIAAICSLGVLAGLHLYWAAGGLWPGRSACDLARTVIGSQDEMASPMACISVAALLLVACYPLAASAGLAGSHVPSWAPVVSRLIAGAFLFRGAVGLFAERLVPQIAGTRFAVLNLRLYSPLCGAIALLCWTASS